MHINGYVQVLCKSAPCHFCLFVDIIVLIAAWIMKYPRAPIIFTFKIQKGGYEFCTARCTCLSYLDQVSTNTIFVLHTFQDKVLVQLTRFFLGRGLCSLCTASFADAGSHALSAFSKTIATFMQHKPVRNYCFSVQCSGVIQHTHL